MTGTRRSMPLTLVAGSVGVSLSHWKRRLRIGGRGLGPPGRRRLADRTPTRAARRHRGLEEEAGLQVWKWTGRIAADHEGELIAIGNGAYPHADVLAVLSERLDAVPQFIGQTRRVPLSRLSRLAVRAYRKPAVFV